MHNTCTNPTCSESNENILDKQYKFPDFPIEKHVKGIVNFLRKMILGFIFLKQYYQY